MGTKKTQFKLREEDILKLGRLILPAANLIIEKARELFSGEPAMTLKVFGGWSQNDFECF